MFGNVGSNTFPTRCAGWASELVRRSYNDSVATAKTSESGGNDKFLYSVSEMQGWRITMEDAHAAVLDLDKESDSRNTFFAVYDGHGGGTVAKFAGQNVHKRLLSEESYHEKQYELALKHAFLGTDEDMRANPAHTRDPSGCTAVAALVTEDGKIYVANAGDSRSVISVKGEVKPLSYDHKPSNEGERARISGAGGFVEFGRVNGNLALSRALGDFEFKKNLSLGPEKQIITADPDISCHQITEEDEFLILACDGIWDCLSSQQVVDFVRYQISEGKELHEIGELMCDHCLAPDTSSGAGIGCDNMTILIVALLHGRTKEEWYAWVKDRVEKGYGYQTPTTLPQLYSQSRLMSFKARQEAQQARERARQEQQGGANAGGGGGAGMFSEPLSHFARVLGSTGGISFMPSSDTSGLAFGNEDSEEDDEEEINQDAGRSFFSETLGLGRPESPDPTRFLREKLQEFERNMQTDGSDALDDEVEDDSGPEHSSSPEPASDGLTPAPAPDSPSHSEKPLQGEAPPPPKALPNGDAPTTAVEQLKSEPQGDEPSPAVKLEGLMDKSEDPTKV
ncbi:hypothetical protein HGRIS_006043 [Hohenbuehelia grisea]|uniref:protein-serine/threonine phosphatase n=1 Tax=Hohenbuehelia grisea TaxID=104357 RepID=A0ABR3JYL5_9AGAR